MDDLVVSFSDKAAIRMKRSGIPPVEAVSAVFKEQRGGGGFDDELKRAVLRELGKRGAMASAKSKKKKKAQEASLLKKMEYEAKLMAFQRRDHLLPDP